MDYFNLFLRGTRTWIKMILPSVNCDINTFSILKWGASAQWSFGPNITWGRIETMTIGKTHPTVVYIYLTV